MPEYSEVNHNIRAVGGGTFSQLTLFGHGDDLALRTFAFTELNPGIDPSIFVHGLVSRCSSLMSLSNSFRSHTRSYGRRLPRSVNPGSSGRRNLLANLT